MNRILKIKRTKMTLGILASYLVMMILVACVNQAETDPFGECPGTVSANASDVSLFYEPSKNYQYATESDTVKFDEFNVYLRITPEPTSDVSWMSSFPGSAYALSCAQLFDFKNITSIAVTLLAPYGGFAAGTDISKHINVSDELLLSELKDFNSSIAQYRLTINILPANESQLKTKTILTLKNGTQKIFESTSPVLLTN
ncbi:hypothetical protein [Algoriphagus chordae]|uniref:Lipoprotein n=1 Tax=Algoriphagus chordae TaxID=237019 RepID=A0A2W7R3W0_9BACT|nr:hypothetical protein [Algoriphagus chordae]PZX54851.1 hypothetical protein LV85_01189 [Algoriphagus chordae]